MFDVFKKVIFIWNLLSFSIIDLRLFLLGLFWMMLSVFYYSGWLNVRIGVNLYFLVCLLINNRVE